MALKKWIAALLSVCMLFSFPVTVKADGGYHLSVDESSCTVSVLDASGNVVLSTNPNDPVEDEYTSASVLNNLCSQLIVTYYDSKKVDSVVGSYLSSVRNNTFTIKKSENKIRIDYDFSRKNEQFKIPVEYSLNGDRFQVTVLSDEIEEYGDKEIYKIAVVPYLLRGTSTMDGYLLIPDGSGAKIDFSNINPYESTYSSPIYGRNVAETQYYAEGNPSQTYLPVFGADYSDYGILATIDGNAAAGMIEANCVGIESSYANAYSVFVYRIFDTVTIAGNDWRYKEYVADSSLIETEDFSVSYHIVENGGLAALVGKCRELFVNPKDSPSEVITAALYAYGLTEQRSSFLGIPYMKTIKATTFDDLDNMLNELSIDGTSLAVMLQDFDKASENETYPSGIKWSSAVGGTRGYDKLLNAYGEQHHFYCVQDFMYENRSLPLWLTQYKYAKMVSNEVLQRYTYSDVTYAHSKEDKYGLRLSNLTKQAEKSLKKAAKDSCGVALKGIGEDLYGDYSTSKATSRATFQKGIERLLEEQSNMLPLAVEGGNAYALGYADVYYNIPVTSSSYHIETETVPFLQMVYHGSTNLVSSTINMTENPKMEALYCVASGTAPCFAVTGRANSDLRRSGYKSLFNTCFETQKDTISDLFARTATYYQKINNQAITSYEYADGISVTTYQNGVTAVVNYTKQPVSYEGCEVAAMDFIIMGLGE